jgi:hypothetical protein
MKRILEIIEKEIIALLLAISIVMAIGLLTDNDSVIQLRNIKKVEIKLKD